MNRSVLLLPLLLWSCGGVPGNADEGALSIAVLDPAEAVRIDGTDQQLSRVTGVAILPDSAVAIAQGQQAEIRFFSWTGAATGRAGGRGQGPGEFTRIGGVGWKGDSVWVADPGLGRLTLLTATGELGRLIDTPEELVLRVGAGEYRLHAYAPLGMDSTGDLVMSVDVGPAGPELGVDPGTTAIGRVGIDGTVKNIIGLIRSGRTQVSTPQGTAVVAFANPGYYAVDPEAGYVVAAYSPLEGEDAESVLITAWNVRGDTLFDTRIPFEGMPVTAAMKDSVGRRIREVLPPVLAAAVEASPLPRYVPPVGRILAGRDGTVWIEWADRSGGTEYLVLDAEGQRMGTLSLPRTSRITAATEHEIWTIERNGVDVESVVRQPVHWGR